MPQLGFKVKTNRSSHCATLPLCHCDCAAWTIALHNYLPWAVIFKNMNPFLLLLVSSVLAFLLSAHHLSNFCLQPTTPFVSGSLSLLYHYALVDNGKETAKHVLYSPLYNKLTKICWITESTLNFKLYGTKH